MDKLNELRIRGVVARKREKIDARSHSGESEMNMSFRRDVAVWL